MLHSLGSAGISIVCRVNIILLFSLLVPFSVAHALYIVITYKPQNAPQGEGADSLGATGGAVPGEPAPAPLGGSKA